MKFDFASIVRIFGIQINARTKFAIWRIHCPKVFDINLGSPKIFDLTLVVLVKISGEWISCHRQKFSATRLSVDRESGIRSLLLLTPRWGVKIFNSRLGSAFQIFGQDFDLSKVWELITRDVRTVQLCAKHCQGWRKWRHHSKNADWL